MKQTIILLIAAIGSTIPSFAQTSGPNSAAVDTLTKDVATVVLANQSGDKAAEIVDQLAACGDGCDAVEVIRRVGGWDAVGVKMQELGRLKSTAQFQTMVPGDANAAIRREFARFYGRHKRDKNYGVPLGPDVQAQLLTKIDRMLPPAVAPPTSAAAAQPADGQAGAVVGPTENANIDVTALRISQLEREVKEKRANRIWMLILSAIAGLLVGAGVVYFMLYRAVKKEVDRLTNDNIKLSGDLDAAWRQKIANEPRQPQPENRRRPETTTQLRPELSRTTPDQATVPNDPKPLADGASATLPVMRSEPSLPGQTESDAEPVPAPIQTQPQLTVPTPTPARDEVFYFPPPDPNGQFDNAQRVDMLSPESAYRFSSSAQTPGVATFRFEAEPGRVARFLTYRNYMIEPACDSENSFSSTYTRILNRRNGEAVLENGAWRVKMKALIRYE